MLTKSLILLTVATVATTQSTPEQQLTLDWDTLRNLMTTDCQATGGGVFTNISQFAIPSNILPSILSLSSVPFPAWMQLNTTPRLATWDTPTLRLWLQNYIIYHNSIAAQTDANKAQQATIASGNVLFPNVPDTTSHLAAGGDTNMAIEAPIVNTLGWDKIQIPSVDLSQPTPFNQNLTFDSIWDPNFDALPFAGAVNKLQQKANNALFETFSFFSLFFGTSGLLTLTGIDQVNQQIAQENSITKSSQDLQMQLINYQLVDNQIKNLAQTLMISGISGVVATTPEQDDASFNSIMSWIQSQFAFQLAESCPCLNTNTTTPAVTGL